jgi:hypothetical protein
VINITNQTGYRNATNESLQLLRGLVPEAHIEVRDEMHRIALEFPCQTPRVKQAERTLLHYQSCPDECIDGWNYLSELRLFGSVTTNPALATMLLPTFPLAVLMTYSTGMVSTDSRGVKRIVKPPPPHHPNE